MFIAAARKGGEAVASRRETISSVSVYGLKKVGAKKELFAVMETLQSPSQSLPSHYRVMAIATISLLTCINMLPNT